MKRKDLKPCCICGKGMMHAGTPLFLRITVERFGIQKAAIMRAHGMETFMQGNIALANIMGADEDLAKVIDGAHDLLICMPCGENPLPAYFWMQPHPEDVQFDAPPHLLRKDDRVRYVPGHAQGDENHPDCEVGIVTSVKPGRVFVRFSGETSQACTPSDLHLISRPGGVS